MRVAVTGATGNVGTSVLAGLCEDPAVDEIVGIARRRPPQPVEKVRWVSADVVTEDLVPVFAGADVVIHLAWLIQPSRDLRTTWSTNVIGSSRVFQAAVDAGVRAIVYSSSVGAYSAGPKDQFVNESWPTDGVPTSTYSREKAYVERILDAFEMRNPDMRIARLRPAFVLKRAAASGIRRLFAGPFLPTPLLRPDLIPLVPRLPQLRFQAVHSLDVGQAFRLAALRADARGAFNVAAEPPLGPDELAALFRARTVPVPAGLLRKLAAFAWRSRLVPTEPGMVDLLLAVPLMDTTRACDELGWQPTHSAGDALLELLEGMRDGAGADTPPLYPGDGVAGRLSELGTGVGARDRR
ncbi:MAG TPA: NAD-dependent epimerase/dehydratase family protein [Pseudonocardiaceae bacterium]|nr:NAD-dependent epimerase/dehydratase family protein [Pseudonocardiaceae bacterium]